MKIQTTILSLSFVLATACAGETCTVTMREGENWWGAANYFGTNMPFTARTDLKIKLTKDNYANQAQTLLLSDKGRAVWSDREADVTIKDGTITLAGSAPVQVVEAGTTLRAAFLYAAKTWFPPSGRTPDLLFISAPQYNTWVELTYHQNEKDILAYAQAMLDHGLPPGILMIDDTWQFGYGVWEFDPRRFSDPKGMCDKLHAMGFKVMLWMCPWVGMDTPAFREIGWGTNHGHVGRLPEYGGFLGRADAPGTPAACRWWNGYSALLDFTHPNARKWFKRELDRLQKDYGVDGFKFDGGALDNYAKGLATHVKGATPGDQVKAYAQFAIDYPVSEYRNAWQMAGQPIVERLHDKDHSWAALSHLVPDMIGAGLLGHPFVCPDMLAGGSWVAFLPGAPIDQELFVRSAQLHALCPMMQFSASPWRFLDAAHQKLVCEAVALRQKFAPRFVALARESGRTGEPMLRNLEYAFPGRGYAAIKDEFLMGDFLLVAPVVTKGTTSRKVVIPPGTWTADDGSVVEGPAEITVAAPLGRLPHFVRR